MAHSTTSLRPKLFWVNVLLIVAAIASLLFSGFAPAVVFMFFYVLATVINYPNVKDTKARVDAHAKSALMMCSVLFAAGCFTGIMQSMEYFLDMRYQGQNHEIRVPINPHEVTDEASIREAFIRTYERLYSFSSDDMVQIVNFGLSAIGDIIYPVVTEEAT